MVAEGVPTVRRGLTGLAAAVVLAAACTSAPKLELESWELKELVASHVRTHMSMGEVRDILGEPTLRRSQVSGGAEWEPSAERRLYSECWYWRSDAVVCFGPVGPDGGVVYKYAAGDSAPH
jgi:hypothetical protein